MCPTGYCIYSLEKDLMGCPLWENFNKEGSATTIKEVEISEEHFF